MFWVVLTLSVLRSSEPVPIIDLLLNLETEMDL